MLVFPKQHFCRGNIPTLLHFTPSVGSLMTINALTTCDFSLITAFVPRVLPRNAIGICCRTTTIVIDLVLLKHCFRTGTGKHASRTVRRLIKVRTGATHVRRGKRVIRIPVTRMAARAVIRVHPNRHIPISNRMIRNRDCVSRSVVANRSIPIGGRINSRIMKKAVGRGKALGFQTATVNSSSMLTRVVHVIRRTRKSGLPVRTLISGIAV